MSLTSLTLPSKQSSITHSSRPGPNGQIADSTNNVLSQELIEIVTDAELNASWNGLDVGTYAEEIGDECEFIQRTANEGNFDPNVTLNNRVT